MKLIIEKVGDSIYAYRESNKHFRKVQPARGKQLDPERLDHECDLSTYPDFHMIFNIKKRKKRK